MTEKQKKLIIQFRKEGLGYMKIGQLVGLTTASVRYFCNKSEGVIYVTAYCKQCGKRILQKKGIKKRLFCSDECRHKWWNEHPNCINRKTFTDHVCECCGKHFQSYGRKARKYCSRECYVKARFGEDGSI